MTEAQDHGHLFVFLWQATFPPIILFCPCGSDGAASPHTQAGGLMNSARPIRAPKPHSLGTVIDKDKHNDPRQANRSLP